MYLNIVRGSLIEADPKFKPFHPYVSRASKYVLYQRVNPYVFEETWAKEVARQLIGPGDFMVYYYVDVPKKEGKTSRYFLLVINLRETTNENVL